VSRSSKKGLSRTTPNSELLLPLTGNSLAGILRLYGYETHPKGMVAPLGSEIEQSSDGWTAYFDVNADAVRRNGEVPDRPIHVTLGKAGVQGGSPVWTLQSVDELAPDVESKALDRMPETPRNDAPWPD
jgi:hypothetical protein